MLLPDSFVMFTLSKGIAVVFVGTCMESLKFCKASSRIRSPRAMLMYMSKEKKKLYQNNT